MDIAQRILNPDQLTSHGNRGARSDIVEILEAGLRAADPYNNTKALFALDGDILTVGHEEFTPPDSPFAVMQTFDLREIDRIYVVGAGKGVQRLARAIEDVLGDRLTGGVVIDKHGGSKICERVEVVFGAHPVPDESCVEGCLKILKLSRDLTERDLVFTLVANGVSSLLTLPVEGVTLEEVRQVTHAMQIERGVPTFDLNPVRNHLDRMKGGRLSRHMRPARLVHIVAYQPHSWSFYMQGNIWQHSLPEASTFDHALEMLDRWDAVDAMPVSVLKFLRAADPAQETVKEKEFMSWGSPIYSVMPKYSYLGMLPTARRKAEELGYNVLVLSAWLQTEASSAAQVIGSIANTIERYGFPVEPPACLINGGELLVTVGNQNGMGGRNQEWAVSAAIQIDGSSNIVMGSVDTDGTDGPGHQFSGGNEDIPVLGGGIVDGKTAMIAGERGVDLWDAQKRHDTSPALWALDCGVQVSHNISLTDLTVALVTGRGINPNWTR